jgi:hypothetical protein
VDVTRAGVSAFNWMEDHDSRTIRSPPRRPRGIRCETPVNLPTKDYTTGYANFGNWAFCKDAFYRVRGYGPHNNGEDQELAGRLHQAGVTVHEPCDVATRFVLAAAAFFVLLLPFAIAAASGAYLFFAQHNC